MKCSGKVENSTREILFDLVGHSDQLLDHKPPNFYFLFLGGGLGSFWLFYLF